ncbi:MAG: NAD(P)/FAD-dependent oxidoreductase [Candidatus Aquicultorales bacterium]
MSEKVEFLIVGGGVAAVRCASTLRSEGAQGRIVMLSAEEYPPYSRPPLSKGLLLGTQKPEDIFIVSDEHYKRNGIELVLGTPVERLDADGKTAHTRDTRYEYDRALIATGCAPRVLPVEGSDLEGVFYLRSLADSKRIKEAMGRAKSAVIVGAGFIGMELASAFAQNGIETTMVVREDRLWGKLGASEISDFFRRLYEGQGVKLLFQDELAGIEGTNGRVSGVVTKGGERLACDIVSIGVGVKPVTDFIESGKIRIDNGVITDEYLRSADESVFAAGDVANYRDPIFEKTWRIEHWDNAIKQGTLAARNMLGQGKPFDVISYFFSEVFQVHYEFLGDNRDVDGVRFIGSFDDRDVLGLYQKADRLKAAFLMGRYVQERPAVERFITEKRGFSEFLSELKTDDSEAGRAA